VREHDLEGLEDVLLLTVGLYYNNYTFEDEDGGQFRLDSHKPPSLHQLLTTFLDVTTEEFHQQFEPAAQRLRERGYFTTRTYLRSHVDYYPTATARDWMNDFFAGYNEYSTEFPEYVDTTDHGLVGDMNESLLHRTGVEHAKRYFATQPGIVLTHDDVYPGDGGRRRADLHYYDEDADEEWLVEVLTEHHDYEAYRKKYAFTADSDRNALYVMQNRKLANRLLSDWTRSDDLQCDIKNFPLDKPAQRAMTHTRDYLERTNEEWPKAAPGVDDVLTFTNVYDNISNT
jgi:hypothetical protein